MIINETRQSTVGQTFQLRRYAADPRIPQLSGGTPVHFIDLEFVGREMRVCEEVIF